MTEATLNHVVAFIQSVCLVLIVGPICFFILYRDSMRKHVASNGRWRYWYAAYAAPVILLLLAEGAT